MRMRMILVLLVAFSWMSCRQGEPISPPNIILIMADDLGYETLGVNGGLEYQTPNLDRIAEEGIRFTNFHATPLCTPSRVQLMTGKYNNRNYVGFGLLDSAETTFAHYLKEAGYRTGVTGKWQLYGNRRQQELAGGRRGSLPSEAGFDKWCLWQVQDRGSRYRSPMVDTNEGLKELPGQYGPDVFLSFAEDFMQAESEKPFFLYYPMCLVHDPFQPTPSDDDFDSFETPLNDTTHFASMVHYMDSIVGRIVKQTQDLDIDNNTLILFIGDNGTDRDVITDHVNGPIPGMKGLTTTYGTHVPFIAWWPGQIGGGTVFSGLADLTDILPTLLELSNSDPDTPGLDGNSMLSQLQGDTTPFRDWIYCYYHPQWGNFEHRSFVFNEQFKLYNDSLFYDMQSDIMEKDPINVDSLKVNQRRIYQQFLQTLRDMQ